MKRGNKNESQYSDVVNELFLYFDTKFEVRSSLVSALIKGAIIVIWWALLFIPYLIFMLLICLVPRLGEKHNESAENLNRSVCIVRSYAARIKLNFLNEKNCLILNDKLLSFTADNNLYNMSIVFRVKSFINSLVVIFAFFKKFFYEVTFFVPIRRIVPLLLFYTARLPHLFLFSAFLGVFLKHFRPNELITANKEDRYALAEKRIAKHYRIYVTCYPHGLEYGLRMPGGVVGDTFYCYSKASRDYYRQIYADFPQEFIFSEYVVRRLLAKDNIVVAGHRRIVFFPERRRRDNNYRIVSALIGLKLDFFVKLHPSESIKKYKELGVEDDRFIFDFAEAINGNIVLSRVSTVLLEALYSNSFSCAVLISDDDYEIFKSRFPSLWDERINVVRSVSGLHRWLTEVQ